MQADTGGSFPRLLGAFKDGEAWAAGARKSGRRPVPCRYLAFVGLLGMLAGCASSHEFRRICGPASIIRDATVIDLRVHDSRQCNAGRDKPVQLTRQLKKEITQRFPDILFGTQDDALLVIVSASDVPRGCVFPSWRWTMAIDAWLPTTRSPTGGTFAAIVEIKGVTKTGGDFVREAIDQFAAVREGKAVLPASTVRCGFGLDAVP